jgi:hypothetical protein
MYGNDLCGCCTTVTLRVLWNSYVVAEKERNCKTRRFQTGVPVIVVGDVCGVSPMTFPRVCEVVRNVKNVLVPGLVCPLERSASFELCLVTADNL